MKKVERYFYPAVFTYVEGQEIAVDFPDLHVATSGKDEEDADCHAEGIQTGNRCMGQRPSGHLPEDIGCCKSEV